MTDADFVPVSARMTEVVEIKLTITMTPELATRYRDRLIHALIAIEGDDVRGPEFDVGTATLSQRTARLFDRQEGPLHELSYVSELAPELVEDYNTFASAVEDDEGDDDALISARVEIFERDGGWWMNITGELFGPFPTEDAAIDIIPQALRSTF